MADQNSDTELFKFEEYTHPSQEEISVSLSGIMWNPPTSEASSIWDIRRGGGPAHVNQWMGTSTRYRRAWTEVACIAHEELRHRRKTQDRKPNSKFSMKTTELLDDSDFYCAIGEAINGPGGYFGRCPDSLIDCLSGGFGATVPFGLDVAVKTSPRGATATEPIDELLSILRNSGVTLTFSSDRCTTWTPGEY